MFTFHVPVAIYSIMVIFGFTDCCMSILSNLIMNYEFAPRVRGGGSF